MSTGDHIEFQAQINKHSNPFIEHVQGKRLPWKKIGLWTGIIFVLLLVALEIGVFRNRHYYVHLAVFTGNVHLSDQALAQQINSTTKGSRLFGLIPKRNILFLPKTEIQKNLNLRFGITNVKIDTIISQQTIHITLQEAPIAYHLQRNDDLLNITRDGHIIASGIKLQQNATPQNKYESLTVVFTDQSQATHSLVQLPKSLMEALKAVDSIANEIQNTIIITKIQLQNETSTDVQVQTTKGWFIRIDTTGNITTEIQNAQKVFAEKIQNTSKENGLQYIDSRIPDRVYYK